MAELFVHAQLGDDSNPGTEALPKRSLNTLDTFFASNPTNSTAHLAGTFRTETFEVSNLVDCTVQQWEGQEEAILRADIDIDTPWIASGGGEYFTDLSNPPSGISRVFENWSERKDDNGANLGSLSNLGETSGAGSLAQNERDYDEGIGRLHVRLYGDDDPNTLRMTYVSSTGPSSDGPTFINCQGITVRGLKIWLYAFFTDESFGDLGGYGLRFISGAQDILIEDCEFRDNGDGHIGFTHSGDVTGVHCRNCTFYGGSDQGGALQVFLDTSSASNFVFEDFRVFGYPFLDRNGVRPTDIPIGVNKYHRIFWLTEGATSGTLQNFVFRNGYVDGYNNAVMARVENDSVIPSDLEDWSTYSIRFEDIIAHRLRAPVENVVVGSAVGFRRCVLHSPAMRDPDTTFDFAFSLVFRSLYLESCVVSGDTGSASVTGLVTISSTTKLIAINSIFYDATITVGATKGIFRFIFSATERLKCVQSLIVSAVGNKIAYTQGVNNVVAANFNMVKNWYFGYAAAMTDESTLDSVSEWQASIDADGIYGVDPEFSDPPTDFQGTIGGALRTTTEVVAGATEKGVNKKPYSGHYGAYQYGVPQVEDPLLVLG